MRERTSKKNKGMALLLVTVLFTAVSMTILLGTISPMIRQIQIARNLDSSKKSYFAAEAGGEDAFYRVKNAMNIAFPLSMSLNDASVSITESTLSSTEEEIESQASHNNDYRTVLKDITVSDGFSFFYGIQTGIGGLYLYNNSSVNGNVYSDGIVLGGNTNANSYNLIKGSVISAGSSGSIKYASSTNSAYAHTISNSTVGGDAYYQAISNTTVLGAQHANSSDQPKIDFPITDQMISDWETDAASGGSATCTNGSYTISSSVTIGPEKIPCNLSISGNGTVVTLTGSVWVTGNITIIGSGGSGVQIKVADSVGDKSVAMIADNPGNDSSSAFIQISGNSNFYGSTGNSNSYVLLVSQNSSAENGGSNLAVDVVNGATGNMLTFAPHGEIKIENNVNLKEVTAYKLSVYNNAVVNYLIGLSQALFTSGPGGTWKIKRWQEI